MVTYTELYGQDIDGNRGQLQYCGEIEPSDRDEIRAQLEFMYEPNQTIYNIFLYDHMHDCEIEFEVNINDYFTYDELKELV